MSPGRFADIKKGEAEKSGSPPQTATTTTTTTTTIENKGKEDFKPFKREFKPPPQEGRVEREKIVRFENRRYPNNNNNNNNNLNLNNNHIQYNNNIITTTTTVTTPPIIYSILRPPPRVERIEKVEKKSEKPQTESVPHEVAGAGEEKKRKRELEIKREEEKEGSEKSTENSENESVRDDKKTKGNDEVKPKDDYQTFKKKVPWVLKCGTETDPARLAARQKQIDFGKNTLGYQEYTKQVPRSRRKYGDPMTPDKNIKCSKRSWDGQIRKWRRSLHNWDPKGDDGEVEITIEEAQAAYADAKDEESEEEVTTPDPDPREQFLTPEFVKKFGTYKEKWEDEASNEPLDSNSNSNVVESDVSLSIYDKFELL